MRTIMMHLIIIQAKTKIMKKNNKTVSSLNNSMEIIIMIKGAKEIKVINLDPA